MTEHRCNKSQDGLLCTFCFKVLKFVTKMHATLVRTVPITRSRLAKEPNYVGICETWITLEAKTECFEKHSTNNLKKKNSRKNMEVFGHFSIQLSDSCGSGRLLNFQQTCILRRILIYLV